MFGPQAGLVGAEAGRLFRRITGFGDYKVASNSLMSQLDQLPAFKNLSQGTRVQHREYLFDVVTSATAGGFKLQTIPIQPALITSFPWLASSAENYQEYKLNGVIFEFKSNSYDALSSTNTASGTVVMSTNYNVLDPPFANKFQMEQSQFTCSGKPSINLLHPIECAKLETPTSVLFTRAGPTSTGDLRLYDWGNFNIATVGMQGTSTNIGELWITYDITLLKPKLGSTVDVYDHYILNPAVFAAAGPQYFGLNTNRPYQTLDSDMGTILNASNISNHGLDTIQWPLGYTGGVVVIYRSEIKSVVSTTLETPYTISYSSGAAPLNAFGLNPFTQITNNNQGIGPLLYGGATGTTFIAFISLTNGGKITLTGGSFATSPLSGDLFIIALPTNFLTIAPPVSPFLSTLAFPRTPFVRRESYEMMEDEKLGSF